MTPWLFYLLVLTGRPPLGVAVIYGLFCLAWWLGSLRPGQARKGVPLHSNGKTTFMELR